MDAIKNLKDKQVGFALVEILIAIMILGTSFVVLLSLQTSAVKKALRDRNYQNAMLVSRSIMSAIEIDPDQLEEQQTDLPAQQMIDELIGAQNSDQDKEEQEFLNKYQASLNVQKAEIPVPIPDQEPIKLKRITLRLSWSNDPLDSFETVFFLPDSEQT